MTVDHHPPFGTIPANTGRMAHVAYLPTGGQDHPREYGENVSVELCGLSAFGPSPRIRGESAPTHEAIQQAGTIPANTGRICCRGLLSRHLWDHPREYGENSSALIAPSAAGGPSPRIRGELRLRACTYAASRTIPANTGRIERGHWYRSVARDHPREYGENLVKMGSDLAATGPSPRIRGESCQDGVGPGRHGTIPANTGRIGRRTERH